MARSHLVAYVADEDGNVAGGAPVYVLVAGGSNTTTDQVPIAIYPTEATSTPQPQPFSTTAAGVLDVWVDGQNRPVTLSTTVNGVTVLQNAEFITDPSAPHVVSVKSFRARGDGVVVLNAAVNASVPELRLADTSQGSFSPADVGKVFTIDGSGPGVLPCQGSITAYISPTRVSISPTPAYTAANRYAAWGTNDQPAIQAAVNAVAARGGTLGFPIGIYVVTSSIVAQSPAVSFVGAGRAAFGGNSYAAGAACILAIGEGFLSGAVLALNTDASVVHNLGDSTYGQGPSVSNIQFFNASDNAQYVPTRFNETAIVNGAAGARFHDIYSIGFTHTYRDNLTSASTGGLAYVDRVSLTNIETGMERNSGQPVDPNANYQIYHGSGDCFMVDGYGGAIQGGAQAPNAIFCSSVMGGYLRRVLVGHIFMTGCNGVVVDGFHGEGEMTIRCRDPFGTVQIGPGYLQRQLYTSAPIILDRSTPGGSLEIPHAQVTLEGLQIHRIADILGPDVQLDPSIAVAARNCERRYSRSAAAFGDYPSFGLRVVGNDGTTPVMGWMTQAGRLSRNGRWDGFVADCRVDAAPLTNGVVLGSGALSSVATWMSTGGTYTYLCDVLYDVNRNIGVFGSSSFTLSPVASGPAVLLTLSTTYAIPGLTLRIWRIATAVPTDLPSFYCDVPLAGRVVYLVDNGHGISGMQWTQVNASGVEKARSQLGNYPPRTSLQGGGTFLAVDGSAPSGGIWQIGDRVTNALPGIGNPKAWLCTQSGKVHPPTTGILASGSNIITSVTTIGTWAIGDAIRGTGVPAGATVALVDVAGTALRISANATAAGSQSLFGDGNFVSEGNL